MYVQPYVGVQGAHLLRDMGVIKISWPNDSAIRCTYDQI